MPVLKNTRHEKFAHASAKGNTVEEAYVPGGFKANRGNAAHLNANESVQDRVAEIQGKGALKAEATVERVLKEFSRIGFSDLRRVFGANVSCFDLKSGTTIQPPQSRRPNARAKSPLRAQ